MKTYFLITDSCLWVINTAGMDIVTTITRLWRVNSSSNTSEYGESFEPTADITMHVVLTNIYSCLFFSNQTLQKKHVFRSIEKTLIICKFTVSSICGDTEAPLSRKQSRYAQLCPLNLSHLYPSNKNLLAGGINYK